MEMAAAIVLGVVAPVVGLVGLLALVATSIIWHANTTISAEPKRRAPRIVTGMQNEMRNVTRRSNAMVMSAREGWRE